MEPATGIFGTMTTAEVRVGETVAVPSGAPIGGAFDGVGVEVTFLVGVGEGNFVGVGVLVGDTLAEAIFVGVGDASFRVTVGDL